MRFIEQTFNSALILAFPFSATAESHFDRAHSWSMSHVFNNWNLDHPMGFLWPLLLLVLLVAAVVLILRLFARPNPVVMNQPDGEIKALEILMQRLASGEINEDEYNRMRDLISKPD